MQRPHDPRALEPQPFSASPHRPAAPLTSKFHFVSLLCAHAHPAARPGSIRGPRLQVAKGRRPPDKDGAALSPSPPNQSPRSKRARAQPRPRRASAQGPLPSDAHLLLRSRRPGRRLTPAKPANRAARRRLRPFPAGASPSGKGSPTSPLAAAHLRSAILSQAMP